MNNKVIIILFLLAAFLVTGCKETHNKAIDIAYQLTATAPDSALSVLDGVDQAKLGKDEMARYDLVYTIAQDAEKICRHCMDRKSCLCCLFNSGILSDCAVGCNYFVDNKAYEERRAQMLSFFREYPEAYDYIMKNYETV